MGMFGKTYGQEKFMREAICSNGELLPMSFPRGKLFGAGCIQWREVVTYVERSRRLASLHILFQCPFARAIAFACKWGIRLDSWRCNNVEKLVTCV